MEWLSLDSGADQRLKGLGVASPDFQVRAHFEALDEGVLIALKLTGFFPHFIFP